MKGYALRSVRTRPVAMAVVALAALVAPVLLITIAITGHDADTLHLSVGDEVGYRFGDGSVQQPLRVVPILDAGRNARQSALIYLAVGLAALAFATLVAANSMGALTSSRRPELWAWRLVGATRKQLMTMLAIEATFVGTLGAVLGGVVGLLSGMAIAIGLGRLPSVPPLSLCLLLLLPVVAVVMATLVSGRRATHRGLQGNGRVSRSWL